MMSSIKVFGRSTDRERNTKLVTKTSKVNGMMASIVVVVTLKDSVVLFSHGWDHDEIWYGLDIPQFS
jgi:hypothetical protein